MQSHAETNSITRLTQIAPNSTPLKELPAQPLCQYHGHFVKLLSSNYPMRNENGNFRPTAKDTISLSSQLRPLRAPNSQNAARSEASVFSGPLIFFLLFSLRKLST